MLLTITTTAKPATDLGYLLHKNPSLLHETTLPVGKAYVFYPTATPSKCTVAVLLDIDPVALVRSAGRGSVPLEQYVSDRPYVASSFMSVALAKLFSTALNGRSKERQELADKDLPLSAEIAVIKSRGGEQLIKSLFEPLGYTVEIDSYLMDSKYPEWGQGNYYTVRLKQKVRLQTLLTHLYVLIPVLDDKKHYWVGEEEIEKLLRRGKGWLESHPQRETIASRYLRHRSRLTHAALARLTQDDPSEQLVIEPENVEDEAVLEAPIRLNDQRLEAVAAVLHELNVQSIVDLGCGEGKLIKMLLSDKAIPRIAGIDVSPRQLEIAADRLRMNELPPTQAKRLSLFQSSVLYRDPRIQGFDAATAMEVIEHLEPNRLQIFSDVLFGFATPRAVVITTPNKEYNARFEKLREGGLRHPDHRFEWTRKEFETWAKDICSTYGYEVQFRGIGDTDAKLGSPTQMGIFTR
jgi:3' terminal RNA ribose 2'-O-methyltransferase Hen1